MSTPKNITKNWLGTIESVQGILLTLSPHNGWTTLQTIQRTYEYVTQNILNDFTYLEEHGDFLFASAEDATESTTKTIEFIQRWYQKGYNPSMLSLCLFAANHFDIKINNDLKKVLTIAAILGEVPNTLAYHNVKHYKKVLIQTIRLITTHNSLNKNTDQACDDSEIALLMLTACIHDLGHDGKGNTVETVYHQARLERQSYQIIIKYFYAIGFKDQNTFETLMDHIRTMLLCTDVSPLGNKNSFTNQMKTIYRQHFKGEKPSAQFKLDPELYLQKENPKLSAMSLLIHEADMASSSSLSYDLTVLETASFYQEIGEKEARPEHILEFINNICQRQALSDAGQKLYSENMKNIIAQAEKDIEAGNKPFPPMDKVPFVTEKI